MKKTRTPSRAARLASAINSVIGAEVLSLGSDPRFEVERVPTGSLVIDRITGGGFPRGRHVELFGDYLAGKSFLLYMTMVLAQQRGELVALIDSEKVFDAAWFRRLGGNPDELVIYRPRTAEQLVEVLMLLADVEGERDVPDIVGVDSVASLLPQEELAKRPTDGEDRTASRARMMSRALRRVTAVNDKTLFIWTNQFIDQVGGYGGKTTPGGRALKFYASIRIEMRKEKREKKGRKRAVKGKIVSKDMPMGHWVLVRAEKQKTARPEMESMFYFDYDRLMIDPEYEIIHLGLEDELISRSGNTFRYEDSDGNEWSGTEARFRRYLIDEEDLREELVWAIGENTKQMADMTTEDDEEEDDDG